MSIVKNLLKNGFASFLQKVIKISEQLILVPFFISSWGAEYYGEWLTLTIIPTMLAFSELGFGTSAGNSLVLAYVDNKKQEAANIGKSGFYMVSILIVLGILISILALYLLFVFNVFEKSLINNYDAIISVGFLMVARIINFYTPLYGAYYRAARKASLSMNLQSGYAIINVIGGLVVLLFGGGVKEFAFISLCLTIIFIPVFIVIAKKTLGLHHSYKGIVLKKHIKSIALKGFGYFLSPIWQALFFQGITFIIRITIGPLAVTIFNTVRTLTRSIVQFFNLINASIYPELQFEVGLGNWDKARKLYRLSFMMLLASSVGGIIFLYFFGIDLYGVWTQKAINMPVLLWNILLLSICFNAIWLTSSIVFQAVNKPYDLTVSGAIASIVSLITTYFFSIKFGLSGVAMGYLLLDIIMVVILFPKGCIEIKQNIKNIFSDCYGDVSNYVYVYNKNNVIKKTK